MKKLYLIPFLLWFPFYWIYFMFDHHQYPTWIIWMGSFIDLTSEITLLVAYFNINLRKYWTLGLNLINFCWYLYYLPTDVSGINGNLEWTLVFIVVDLMMAILSFDNLINLWHENAPNNSYDENTIPHRFLVSWYFSLVGVLFLRVLIYGRR